MLSTINSDTMALYKKKVAQASREELEEMAANALYHLQVVCGSRNSFESDPNSLGGLVRGQIVENMQHEAAAFSRQHSV